MLKQHEAIIFDMDGVIINSEHLWQQAELEIFSALGVVMSHALSELTKAMTTVEVTKFWHDRYPWRNKSLYEAEQLVISRVIELIKTEEIEIVGLKLFLIKLKSQGFKIGLATNSPYKIIPVVLQKLGITHFFDTLSSAEFQKAGKPHPAIYLATSRQLEISPGNCIVIEDSYSGMLAAKRAGMKVVAFTNGNNNINLDLADYIIDSFENLDAEIFY